MMKIVFWLVPTKMKIIGYSLSMLEVKLCSYSRETKILFTKLKELSTTCVNSLIAIMFLDPKFLLIR